MKVKNYFPLLFTMILMFSESMSSILAGDPPEEITKGKHIEKQIAPNETHRYFVSLKKEKFLLEVKPLDWNVNPGKYRLSIIKLEPRAKSPEGQVDQLFASLDLEDSPGVAIGVAKNGEIIYQKGYGKANLEYNISITPTTVFHMAYVSKQFTAFSIALLAENGELSVSDDVRKYIPELPDFGKIITLEQLIHHTSGLRDQWNLLAMAGWRLDDVITREQILKPLGMDHTQFYDDHEKIVEGRAHSYKQASGGYKKSVLSYANVGATSLFTTVADLDKWIGNFTELKVGNSAVMESMNRRGILNNGDTLQYAYGQGIGKYKGLKTISHGGADAGYRTYLVRFPDQGYGFIVLSNMASANTYRMSMDMADIYLSGLLKPSEIELPKETGILESYCGRYEIIPGTILNVELKGGKLVDTEAIRGGDYRTETCRI